jgi:hypothetical protein
MIFNFGECGLIYLIWFAAGIGLGIVIKSVWDKLRRLR